MNLTFGRARTNGTPRYEISDVLRGNHVKKLAASREPKRTDVPQQQARESKTLVDVEAAIESGIVDESLSTNRRSRLFEVHAHNDFEIADVFFSLSDEQPRILHRCFGVVN